MKINVYSVRDIKACAYLPPFVLPNDGTAIRAMTDCLNDEGHTFAKHPEDYTLVQLGEYCDQSGLLSGDQPKDVISLFALKTQLMENNNG